MDAQSIARLMTAGLAAPTGADDTGLYTGVILSWDEASALNSVQINGVAMSNLRVIQSGIGIAYQPGDTVSIQRKGTQYFIQGRIAAPGAGAANQIQSAEILTSETTGNTSYTDLATFGPQVTVTVGSSRRCLVIFGANFSVAGVAAGSYLGGLMSFSVSGTSSIAAGATEAVSAIYDPGNPGGVGLSATTTRQKLLTAADGLNAGSNTFLTKYRSNIATPVAGFKQRIITVIPF